jgi:hypothetical protein
MLPKRTTLVTFPRKYGSLLTCSTRLRNCCSAFSAVARVIRSAAVADERVCPAWVIFHASRPTASISPSDNRALISAGTSPAVTAAADSNSPRVQCKRVRSRRSVRRTSRAGHSATVPFGSIRIWFQDRPALPSPSSTSIRRTELPGNRDFRKLAKRPKVPSWSSMWDVLLQWLARTPLPPRLQAGEKLYGEIQSGELTSGDIRRYRKFPRGAPPLRARGASDNLSACPARQRHTTCTRRRFVHLEPKSRVQPRLLLQPSFILLVFTAAHLRATNVSWGATECRVELPGLGSLAGPGKTRVVPLPPGDMLPRLPPLGMRSPDEPALFPGSSFIEHSKLEMGRDQRRQTGVNPAGASTQDGHATVPNSAPTPAVTAIARAPQNVTRKHEHSHRTLRESQKSNNPSVSAGLPSRPPRPSNPNPSHPQPSVRSEVVKEFARHAKPLVPALE